MFNLHGPDSCYAYWHDKRKEKRVLPYLQAGGSSVMIWGGISKHGKTSIAIIKENMNSENYQNLLSDHLFPFYHEHYEKNLIFMQDNAPCHASFATKEFLKDNNIEVLEWPAKSPDLNPIENVWSILTRRVYKNGKMFSQKQQLQTAIIDEWNSLSQEDIDTLFATMENRKNTGGGRGGKEKSSK